MTLNDANKLLALAKANYSYAFKAMTRQEKIMLVHSWAFALQDIPADIVMLAFMQLLAVSKWLPTVAEIRERVKLLHTEAEYADCGEAQAPTREYIERATRHLRGDGPPELPLETILNGPYMPGLGSGTMDLRTIEARCAGLPALEEEP